MGAVCCLPKRSRRVRQATSRQTTECEFVRAWYASVTSGSACVDIRSFYKPSEIWKKTDRDPHCISYQGVVSGIGMPYGISCTNPRLGYPILSQHDVHPGHYNQESANACQECSLFHWFELFHWHLI